MLKLFTVGYVGGIPIKFYQDINDGEILIDGEDLRKALEASPEEWALANERAQLEEGTDYREMNPFDVINPN